MLVTSSKMKPQQHTTESRCHAQHATVMQQAQQCGDVVTASCRAAFFVLKLMTTMCVLLYLIMDVPRHRRIIRIAESLLNSLLAKCAIL